MQDKRHGGRRAGGGDAVYGIGIIGAVVYYIQAATGFWSGVFGIFKGVFWPAFFVYDVLKYISG